MVTLLLVQDPSEGPYGAPAGTRERFCGGVLILVVTGPDRLLVERFKGLLGRGGVPGVGIPAQEFLSDVPTELEEVVRKGWAAPLPTAR